MTAEQLAIMEAEFLGIINEDAVSVFVGGKEYTGRKTGLTKTGKAGENGFRPDYDMTVSIYTTDKFTVNSVATINSVNYRILKVIDTTMSFHQKLGLGSEFQ